MARLAPEAAFYGDAYDRFGLFGKDGRTVMAHCVYSPPEEVQRMLDNGVWIAHCPGSNMNIASGIAPVRHYLERGLRIGLGTDVAGGDSESMFRAVTDAIRASKMYWRYIDHNAKPLTFPEAFWLASKGGGSFFGRVGSFEEGYAFDGYLRKDDPTGAKVEMGSREGEWATYDFSDDMRTCQVGVAVGIDWNFYRQFGLSADLSWGLTGIHHSNFKTVEQTLYPIYGTIGLVYYIKH